MLACFWSPAPIRPPRGRTLHHELRPLKTTTAWHMEHSAHRATVPAAIIQVSQVKHTAHLSARYCVVRYVQGCRPQQPRPLTWLWEHVKDTHSPHSETESSNSISSCTAHDNRRLLLSCSIQLDSSLLRPITSRTIIYKLVKTHPQTQLHNHSRHDNLSATTFNWSKVHTLFSQTYCQGYRPERLQG
jgi:hypothetical protein